MISLIEQPLISLMQQTGVLWIAIALLVVIIRLALLPLNIQFVKHQRKLQAVKEELDTLKKKYKDDQQEFTKQMFALYKRDNIKISYIFLMLIIQIPIYIVIFFAIQGIAIPETIDTSFLFFDLQILKNDIFFGFIVGVVQLVNIYINQKVNPATDEKAKKIQRCMLIFLPFIVGGSVLFLGNTLGFYFLAMSMFSILQDIVIYWYLKPKEKDHAY